MHRIPLPPPPPDTLTVKEVSRRYGVSAGVVYYWIEHGLVPAHRRRPGCPYAITLDATTDAALRQRAATVKRPASTNSPNPS
ncbi:MerR family transcriptional regulator [Azospirillum canadense]|uniref:MerR family transcriptional regulator n=1 Tax=Azospirillum canadense TaxID=403962 RepID=UPI002227AB0D|nr:MerR family DNA-binding transcriptional regulator [Azospirillum canadense]MCW2239274.1 transposase-like protein [Azospirillum canadense]